MTKRLSAGVLLFALGAMLATTAYAERPQGREWRPGDLDPRTDSSVPLFFRSSAGTTWVSVGQNCADGDTANSTHSPDEVWCFEGTNGDSTWPNVPGAQDTGSRREDWDHWSKFAPPLPPASKWQVTTFEPSGVGSDNNAFCGCTGVATGCEDVAFWVFQNGYGDDWNFSLELDMTGQNANAGGTIEFDLRYDTECNYDYLYLEYLNNSSGNWEAVTDTAGTDAIFNAVSGNPDTNNGGSGRECGDDIYGNSDQKDLGSGNQPYYGNSAWLTDVTFPLPAQSGGITLRWRGFSDGAWSDADGRGDTDGIGAIDNVSITFTGSGSVVSDAFDSGDFNGVAATIGTAAWDPKGLEGNSYDGWQLQFDPQYKNKGNTCTFSDNWMWAAKPEGGPIPANGFSYYLVTPVIDCDGWTGGLIEYASYLCADDARDDYSNQLARFYDSAQGQWGLWQDFDGFITFAGCEFWNMNATDDLSTYLGTDIDSLQVAYEMLDVSQDGEFSWGKHGGVQYLIDNVSIGSFDASATQFTTAGINIFADTYSRVDPAHTPFLQNAEQGMWPTRNFSDQDSLEVEVTDVDGITDGNVTIHWRIAENDPPTFGAWNSKAMNFSQPLAPPVGDQGVYRTTFGNDGSEDYSGSTGDGLIWDAGTTVEYYVKALDDAANPTTTFPAAAADLVDPAYFRFEVLPFAGRTVGGNNERILIVDDYTRLFLDFENSNGFEATGGAGFGNFTDPVFDQPEDMVERALGLMYGIANPESLPQWDIYDVQGAGSSVQCEPRVISALPGIGGIGNDLGIPVYDAVIWMNGSFDAYSFADTTRLDLRTWLDSGGNLWSNGDDVARFLGTAGNDADSTIGFITDYFGMAFSNSADDATDNRVLNVVGEAGSSLDGCTFGIYGECPQRRAFDRIDLAPAGANNTPSVLMRYGAGGANDNGRVAVVKNQVFDGGSPTGVAIHAAFGLGAMLSDASRATILSKTFATDFGMFATNFDGGNNGVDVPQISGLAGFDLAGASPNPFNANTDISFTVPSRSHVSIEVYNILGQKVRTLVDETLEGDSYVREWDGRTDNGERVSSGIYFYKMVAGQFSATQKAVLLK